MKKLFFIPLACVAFHFTGIAQNTRFGFAAGTAFANYNKANSSDENGNSKTGITAGVLVDIPVSQHFSFQPAVNFIQKGTQGQEWGPKIDVNCIEVPLNLLFNSRGSTGNFFIGSGPSLAFAFSGKFTIPDPLDRPVTRDLKIGNGSDDDMKGLDLGANFITGYSFPNGLFLSVNYNAGLNNLSPGGSGNGTMKSHYFGIKLGYLLNGKGKNKILLKG